MNLNFLLNNISECNTCLNCGILCKYGIELHRCSKDPCMQQSIKSFDDNRNAIKRRKFVHSRGRKFKCSICPFATKYKSNLDVHQLRHLPDSEHNFRCSVCSYATKDKGYLKTHELNHSDEHKFKCRTCSYSTNNRSCLKIHELNHSGERKFRCNHCSFSTHMKGNLR